jgi:hypothetical protein
MIFTNKQDNDILFETEINIKAHTKITEKDKERINKIALLIDSLGYEEDTTEKTYRFVKGVDEKELLLDIEE